MNSFENMKLCLKSRNQDNLNLILNLKLTQLLTLFLLIILSSYTNADIRKNKLVQENIPLKIQDNKYAFNVYKILKNPKAYKTAIGIFEDRYKNEKLDAIIIMEIEDLILAGPLAEKTGIPVIINTLENIESFIKKDGRYLVCNNVIQKSQNLQKLISLIEKKHAFLMEIFCFTEILHYKARTEINAQIISIFLDRKTAIAPKTQS